MNGDPKFFNYSQNFILDAYELKDYSCIKPKLTVLTEVTCPSELYRSLLLIIAYLKDLHSKKKLFHGDIKPANIFLGLSNGIISTDSGSLRPLECITED